MNKIPFLNPETMFHFPCTWSSFSWSSCTSM